MDLKSLSIADLKAITDYCGEWMSHFRDMKSTLLSGVKTANSKEYYDNKIWQYSQIHTEAILELSLRLGIKE